MFSLQYTTAGCATTNRMAKGDANTLLERQSTYEPLIPGIEGVLEYASQTFASQIIGAVTDINQLKILCQYADKLDTRLAQEGYDVAYIKNAICEASNASSLATNDQVRARVSPRFQKLFPVDAC